MSMPDSQRYLLNRNRVQLVRELIPNDEFFAVLMGDYTLTPSMVEDIQSAKTTQGKVGKFLDILPKRGAKAFQTFLDALRETHQDHLLNILDPSHADSSQRIGSGLISQPVEDRRDTGNPKPPQQTSVQPSKNPKQISIKPSVNPQQASVGLPEKFEQKPVQVEPVFPVDFVKTSGKVLDEIIHLVNKIIESDNFIKFDSPDLQCVEGSEANREKLLMSSGRGAIVRMVSSAGMPSAAMSFDDINLVEAFKKFGFDVKTQSCEDLMSSLEKEETSAVIVFVFGSRSPDVAEEISRITEILKNSAVLKGKPKVLIHQTIAAGVPSGDQMDSVRDDVVRKLSDISLDGSDDNMAVLSVFISEGPRRSSFAEYFGAAPEFVESESLLQC